MADLSASTVLLVGADDLVTRGWTEGLAEARARIRVALPGLPDPEAGAGWIERVHGLGGELELRDADGVCMPHEWRRWLRAEAVDDATEAATLWLLGSTLPALPAAGSSANLLSGRAAGLLSLALEAAPAASPLRLGLVIQPRTDLVQDTNTLAALRRLVGDAATGVASDCVVFGLCSMPVEPGFDALLRRTDAEGAVDPNLASRVSPRLPGRALAALCKDPDLAEKHGRLLGLSEVIGEYRLRDIDGVVPTLTP